MPRARGAPVNPTYSRWRSKACTAGVQGPAFRRTVSPERTTMEVFPPCSGISCCVTSTVLRRSYRPRLRVAANERLDELSGIERRKVIRPLPQADELDRYAQFALNGDDDAALRRPVELGKHHPGHV